MPTSCSDCWFLNRSCNRHNSDPHSSMRSSSLDLHPLFSLSKHYHRDVAYRTDGDRAPS